MITSALISIIAWVVYGVATVLPEFQLLPANFSDLISDMVSYAYGWDWIVPMSTLFSVFGAIILFFVAEISWRAGKYLIALFRGN